MISNFDAVAPTFERYRGLPRGVPEAIRSAILQATRKQPPARVLDLGAGTGRIGKAFVAANDFYVGVDASLGMLQEFLLTTRNSCLAQACLAQADGQRLPFRDGAFDVVMLMQVLGGAGNWRGLLSEARRVLRPGGAVVAGHRVAPAAGVDAQLKKRLAAILETMGVERHQGKQSRDQALAWLGSSAARPAPSAGGNMGAKPHPARISRSPPHRRALRRTAGCRPGRGIGETERLGRKDLWFVRCRLSRGARF